MQYMGYNTIRSLQLYKNFPLAIFTTEFHKNYSEYVRMHTSPHLGRKNHKADMRHQSLNRN